MHIDGAIGVALVNFESGVCLGTMGGGSLDMELAGAATTDVVRSKINLIDQLALDDQIEDILITLGNQYHLIHSFPRHESVFSYLILNREKATLPLARTHLRSIGRSLSLDES